MVSGTPTAAELFARIEVANYNTSASYRQVTNSRLRKHPLGSRTGNDEVIGPIDKEVDGHMPLLYRELNESEVANLALGRASDFKPSSRDEILASNRATALIRRATITGALQRIPGQPYFERRDAEAFAQQVQHLPEGLTRFFAPWHAPSQNECRWLLCGLDPAVARTEQELKDVWNDVCDAEEAIERAITVGRLASIAKTDANPGERIYKEARFVLPGELLRWAMESKCFPRFVALAQDYGLHPAPVKPDIPILEAVADGQAAPDPAMAIGETLDAGNRREAVRLWRQRTGKTKAYLYQKAGIDHSDYYKWENGQIPDSSVKHSSLRRELLTF
jgi:hypothetical protein